MAAPESPDHLDLADAPLAVPLTAGNVSSKLAALQTLSAKLIYLHDDSLLYDEMVASLQKIIGCDFCALYTYEEARGALKLRACHGYAESVVGTELSLEEGSSSQAQAVLEQYLICVPDLAGSGQEGCLDPELRSQLVIPILSKRGPAGVIEVGSRQPDAFSNQDIQLASMLVDQMAFSLENIQLLEELTATRDAVIQGMALLAESRDAHIGGHLNRICAYSRHLSQKLMRLPRFRPEVDEHFVETITRSAALHDIGKVGIPDHILLKPGKLTPEEYETMKTHSDIGAALLSELMRDHGAFYMLKMGAEVAGGHHERWDGTGYPQGLRAEQIPLSARIVAICDVYDAMTSRRVYKEAMDHQEAYSYIVERPGSQFDPHLVEIFKSMAGDLLVIRQRYPD
jgi:HD-GYP domain-containing protein (c-di-GMP phosphodiesterase class II)